MYSVCDETQPSVTPKSHQHCVHVPTYSCNVCLALLAPQLHSPIFVTWRSCTLHFTQNACACVRSLTSVHVHVIYVLYVYFCLCCFLSLHKLVCYICGFPCIGACALVSDLWCRGYNIKCCVNHTEFCYVHVILSID